LLEIVFLRFYMFTMTKILSLFYTIYQFLCDHLIFRKLTSVMYVVDTNRALY